MKYKRTKRLLKPKIEPRPSFLNLALQSPAERGDWIIRRVLTVAERVKQLDIDLSKLSRAEMHGALLVLDRLTSSRRVGRPKKHNDDVELVLAVELLRKRDRLSIAKACTVIASGNRKSVYERYKKLRGSTHWKVILKILAGLEIRVGRAFYIQTLEEALDDRALIEIAKG